MRYIKTLEAITKLGRSGKYIEKDTYNHVQVYKSILKWLDDNNYDYNVNNSRSTSSKYINITDTLGNKIKFRLANHSKAIRDEYEIEDFEIIFYTNDNTFDIEVDTFVNKLKKQDLINILFIINSISDKLGKDELKFNNDYIHSITPEKLMKSFNVINDNYNLSKRMFHAIIDDYKRFNDSYQEYYRKIKDEDERIRLEKTINGVFDFNGIKVTVKYNRPVNVDFGDVFKGSRFKRKRKVIKDYLLYEIGNKLVDGDIDLNEYKKLALNKIEISSRDYI